MTSERALFEFDCPNPPLSWHLTEEQKDDIDKEWRDEIDDETDQVPEGSGNEEGGWAKVKRFLADP